MSWGPAKKRVGFIGIKSRKGRTYVITIYSWLRVRSMQRPVEIRRQQIM